MLVFYAKIVNQVHKLHGTIKKIYDFNQTSDIVGTATRSPGLNGGKPRAGQPAHRKASPK